MSYWIVTQMHCLQAKTEAAAEWWRHRCREDEGSNTLEWIVIAAIMFTAAVAAVGLVYSLIKNYMGKLG